MLNGDLDLVEPRFTVLCGIKPRDLHAATFPMLSPSAELKPNASGERRATPYKPAPTADAHCGPSAPLLGSARCSLAPMRSPHALAASMGRAFWIDFKCRLRAEKAHIK